MPRWLTPALAVTDRLRTRARLLALVAVLLVPTVLATGSFGAVITGQIAFTTSEIDGVEVVRPVVDALADVVEGRPPDLAPVRAQVRAHPGLEVQPALDAVERSLSEPAPATAQALAQLVTVVGDRSKLILDPDLDTYYLMDALVVQVPRVLVALGPPPGDSPGPATTTLTGRAMQAGALGLASQDLRADMATAVENTRTADLGSRVGPVLVAADALGELGEQVTLTLAVAPPDETLRRQAAASRVDEAATVLATELTTLLQRRADALSLRRDLTLVGTLAGLAVAGWISAAVIWRTRSDVDLTLAGVAAISDGDLEPRALPQGSDEFGDIGRAVHGARDRLEGLIFRDPLTALPNRPLFMDRLGHALAERRPGGLVSVLFLDLDRFKAVNDRLGHAAGDDLLREAGERIDRCTRATDVAARFGGDEFAVVLAEHEGADDARRHATAVAGRIVAALREPFSIAGSPVFIGVTIGIAHADGTDATVDDEQLLAQADIALYTAKRDGGGQARSYDPTMRATHLQRLQLEAELQSALPNGELAVHYQPIVRLQDGVTQGLEALLRWDRPDEEAVSPAHFIPIAESSGLIVDIGRWVLGQTCTQLAQLRRTHPTLTANVNVSAQQLSDPAFVMDVERALQLSGLPGLAITLEITESIFLQDRTSLVESLHAVRDLGTRVALDDFGTGYSCLSYLQHLPVDILKIDRSFVSGTASGSNASLVRTVLELGRGLGLSTTAEGIETDEQWERLRELGCESGQGYLFSRPLPPPAVEPYLRAAPLPVPGRPCVGVLSSRG